MAFGLKGCHQAWLKRKRTTVGVLTSCRGPRIKGQGHFFVSFTCENTVFIIFNCIYTYSVFGSHSSPMPPQLLLMSPPLTSAQLLPCQEDTVFSHIPQSVAFIISSFAKMVPEPQGSFYSYFYFFNFTMCVPYLYYFPFFLPSLTPPAPSQIHGILF